MRDPLRFFVLIGAIVVFSTACDTGGRESAGDSPSDSAAAAATPVSATGTQTVNGRRPERRPELPIATAEEAVRSRSVLVSGRLRPKSRIVHQIPETGYVRSVDVREGQRVAAGQTLVTVERNEVGRTYLPVTVPARMGGTVSEVLVQAGAEVGNGDPAVTVIGNDGYELEALISDKDAFKVPVGSRVRARSPRDVVIEGTLAVRSQEPDYSTGLFELTFEFPAGVDAHVGEFFLIELPTDRQRGVFVSRDLVSRRYGKYFLWVVSDQNTLELREVTLGEAYGEELHIVSGLQPGERYLSRVTGREREGTPVGRSGEDE